MTYLLAIGAGRLAEDDRGAVSIPIYLGDSLQWEQHHDLIGGAEFVTISTNGDDLVTGGGGMLFGDDLKFPRSVLNDATTFDQLVGAMADRAEDTSNRSSAEVIKAVLKQFAVTPADKPILEQTFDTMRRLEADGRDHIWGYYIRNLIRPLWLAELANRVDVLIGNPPWLRYSKMLTSMQTRYKTLSRERGLLTGGLGASSRDLSTLFVVRAVELYLRLGGTFSFVMPHGIMTRKPHDGFRSGRWSSRQGAHITVAFDESWDLSGAPTGFPMVSCVVRGTHTDNAPGRLRAAMRKWAAKFPSPNVTWAAVEDKFSITAGKVIQLAPGDTLPESPYRSRFRQGAVLVPRVLLFATRSSPGPLGSGAGRVALQSRPSTQKPWKLVPLISGNVERAFVHPVYLGENTLHYRLLDALEAVLPIAKDKLMTAGQIDEQPGLAAWWATAETSWDANKKAESTEGPLTERIDTYRQLSAQLQTTKHRVVYTKAGNRLAAARVSDPKSIIDHKLYWCAASSLDEARYLEATLNSQTLLERVKPYQALGLFKGRDFDKNVFMVPIPTYDPRNDDHRAVADLARQAEELADSVDVEGVRTFQQARERIRQALFASGLKGKIEKMVEKLLPALDEP